MKYFKFLSMLFFPLLHLKLLTRHKGVPFEAKPSIRIYFFVVRSQALNSDLFGWIRRIQFCNMINDVIKPNLKIEEWINNPSQKVIFLS